MARPQLGVMALYLNGNKLEELRYFQRLFVEAGKLGLDLIVFTPEDVHPSQPQVKAWLYDRDKGWYRAWRPMPAMIYDRCRYQKTYRYKILRKFRSDYKDLLYMSRPIALKWGVYQLLSKNRELRRSLPATVPYRHASDLQTFLERYDLLYLKPIDGTGGRGVIRIENKKDGTYVVEARDRSRRILPLQRIKARELSGRLSAFELKDRYLIQQGIPTRLADGRVHDFRLLLQKNGQGEWEVTGGAGRIGAARSITSNLHGGGTATPMIKLLRTRFSSDQRAQTIVRAMEQLGFETVAELEREYGQMVELALDVAVDASGRAWLLEVNPKPSREVFREIGEKDTYAKAIRRPLEYALWLYSRRKPRRSEAAGEDVR